MHIPPLQAELMTTLAPFFYAQNFELINEYQQFRRSFEGGFESVVFAFTAYEQESIGEVFLGIRLEAVESLMLQFSSYFSDYKPQATTLLVSIGRLQGKKHFRLQLKERESIVAQSQYIEAFMQEQGKNFLSSCHDIAFLDDLFNQHAEQAHPYFPNHYHRALRGLILAKLRGKYDLETLNEQYQNLLDTRSPIASQKEKLARLANFLQQFSFN